MSLTPQLHAKAGRPPPASTTVAPASEGGAPARRAALLLHAMSPADRDWVLEQLPAAARARVRGLLDELAELGIPADEVLLEGLRDASPAPVAQPRSAAPPLSAIEGTGAVAVLEAADPREVARVLRNEPLGIVVHLLKAREWTWRDALLSELGVVERRRVEEKLAAHGAVHASAGERRVLHEHLIAGIARRLPPRAEPLAAPPGAPAAARRRTLSTSLGRWLPVLLRRGGGR